MLSVYSTVPANWAKFISIIFSIIISIKIFLQNKTISNPIYNLV